jgi:hypothetical protein
MSKLFDEVVALSGLATMIGPGTVQRALAAVGIPVPELAKRRDYERALPQLKARMAIYLSPENLERQVQGIAALLANTQD